MTTISTMGQVNDQIARLTALQEQLNNLTIQISSGKKTNLFKGLGMDVTTDAKAHSNLDMLAAFNNNITIADRRIKMMNSSMGQFQNQTRNIVSSMEIQTQEGQIDLNTLGRLGDNSVAFMTNLLNTQDGDHYLFGGADTLTPPIGSTGTLDTYLQTQINNWVNGTITTDQLIASYRDRTQLTDTLMGYSPTLAAGNAKGLYVRADANADINYTSLASAQGYRDLLVGANMIKNLSQILDKVSLEATDNPATTVTAPGAGKTQQNDNFFQVYNDIIVMMNSGLKLVDDESTNVGLAWNQMQQIQSNHTVDQNTLQSTIGTLEDVDLNDAALKISALQTQLSASYQITAALSNLSLTKYL